MTGFYKDYADSSDTHQNSAEASADAAEVSANEAAASASEAATSASEAATSASEAAASLAAQEDLEVTSASFDTSDGTLTLTRANSGTVTTDLDGRYAELTGATFTGDVSFGDNLKAKFGAGDDLLIYHKTTSGTRSVIEDAGNGGLDLITNGTSIRLMTDTGETMLNATRNSGITLTYDNSIKLKTTIDGVEFWDDAQFNTNINVDGDATVGGELTVTGSAEAELFKGDLEGAVHFKGAVASGATLTKGDVVYVSGHSGQKTEVDLADASDSSKMPAFGIVAADPVGVNVDVVTFGTLQTIDTSSYTDGDELFVDTTAGGLTATAPSGEGNLVQKIAKVVRAANSGNIKVMGAGRTNATPNLNDGNIFIGDSNNLATTASFATEVANATTGKANLSGADFTGDVSVAGTLNTDSIESTINSVDYPVYSTSLDGSNAIATLGGTATGNKVHTLEMRPAAGGVRMHWHESGLYGGSPPPSGQTLRFHTTDRGIHVGDDLVGTYTAGDNQSNADLDFGMLVGRSSTNIGSNNFGFGYNHSFNHSNIVSCLAAGSSITFHNKTLNSIGMGADVQVGEYNSPSTDPNRQAIFAGGNVVSAEGEYSFTWAKGDWGAGSNGQVRYTATNRGTGCVLFGYQTKILSTCNYSFNGGSRGLSGDYKHQRLDDCDYTISWGFQNETDRSDSTAVFGRENDVADSSTTIVAGSTNTVKDSKYASVTGFSNASYCYGGVIGGQSNIVGYDVDDDTTGKYSACFGFDNLVEGDGNLVSGYENNTLGVGGACIGRGLKTPLFEPYNGGDYVWDDYTITVGAYNDEAHKYTTNTLGSSWVTEHRFVVGTGTASNAKDNGFIVAVPDSGFSGIIMPNLASSPSYTDDIAAVAGGVPVGGLYHTNGVVKVRRS